MANRRFHYEAAFEDYLRSRGLPYVAVDEAKKAIFGSIPLKSFDFVVYSEGGVNLLVDVKGRKFPDAIPGPKRGASRAWENWVTREDMEGLAEWQGVFGEGFEAVFLFAYWLQGPAGRSPFEDLHVFRQNHYAFMAITLAEYATLARPRSRKWQTLSVPGKEFSLRAKDITTFL